MVSILRQSLFQQLLCDLSVCSKPRFIIMAVACIQVNKKIICFIYRAREENDSSVKYRDSELLHFGPQLNHVRGCVLKWGFAFSFHFKFIF